MRLGAEPYPGKKSNLIVVHAKSGTYHLRINRADKRSKGRKALKKELIDLINVMLNLEKL